MICSAWSFDSQYKNTTFCCSDPDLKRSASPAFWLSYRIYTEPFGGCNFWSSHFKKVIVAPCECYFAVIFFKLQTPSVWRSGPEVPLKRKERKIPPVPPSCRCWRCAGGTVRAACAFAVAVLSFVTSKWRKLVAAFSPKLNVRSKSSTLESLWCDVCGNKLQHIRIWWSECEQSLLLELPV